MRFALLVAFVSSVFFTTEPVEARPTGDSIVEARKPKLQRRKARPTAKKATKKSALKKTKVKEEEVAVREEVEAPAAKPEAPPPVRRAPVSQATDDEVPRNEPKPRAR